MISTAQGLTSLGTILGIWAHPDDEVFCMGGLLAAAAANGQKIICVTATRGEGGVQDEARWPAAKLGAIREAELAEAYKVLGIKDHHYLDIADGACEQAHEDSVLQRLVSLINTYKPDSIFTFAPDGLTGHPDHQAVSRWASLAKQKSGSEARIYHAALTGIQKEGLAAADAQFNIFFNVDEPLISEDEKCAILLKLEDQFFDAKMNALGAMPSQFEAMLAAFGGNLRAGFGTEAFVNASVETLVL